MSNKDSNSSKIGEYLKQLNMTTIGMDGIIGNQASNMNGKIQYYIIRNR